MKRGFTIFFAVLVASLAMSVGLAIYDLLIRELALSQVAAQSQYAIYAADTGAECALYWDSKFSSVTDTDMSAFATSSETAAGDLASAGEALCNGQDITAGSIISNFSNLPSNGNTGWAIVSDTNQAVTTFQISIGAALTSPCAQVVVTKVGNPSATTVVSHGYNTCSGGGVVRIERALQVSY